MPAHKSCSCWKIITRECFTTGYSIVWAKPQKYWPDKIYWSQHLISANHYYASGVITVKIKLGICIQLVWPLIEMDGWMITSIRLMMHLIIILYYNSIVWVYFVIRDVKWALTFRLMHDAEQRIRPAFIWFPCLLAKYHNQQLLSIHRLVLCKHSMLHGIDNDNKPIMTSRPTYLFTVKP